MAETTLIASGVKRGALPSFFKADSSDLNNNLATPSDASVRDGATLVADCGGFDKEHKIVIVEPETLTSCSHSQVGEIWVSGPSVAQGYWNKPELTKETFRAYLSESGEGPFFRAGDLGFIKNGELFVTGRIKDLIIIRGQNHYPQDIELTAEQSHESLRAGCSAAFSVELENEERLVVVQEIKPKGLEDIDADEAFKSIRESVAENHQLRVYNIVLIEPRSIPKTSSGKIQRNACKQMFLDGKLKKAAEWKVDSPARGDAASDPIGERAASPSTKTGDQKSARIIRDRIIEIIVRESGASADEINADDPCSEIITVNAPHPLIDVNVSGFQEQAFEKKFTGEEFYLTDHRLKGEKILPGVACLEMAKAAAELSNKKIPVKKLQNLTWARPVKIGADPEKVKISLSLENTKVLWKISESDGKTLYSQGELEYKFEEKDKVADVFSLEDIKKRCSESKSKAECYQNFKKSGFDYGPAFQTIESLSYNESEALSLLKSPEFLKAEFDQFGLHPSLLDGALQTVAPLLQNGDEPEAVFLPFGLKEAKILRPLNEEIYAHAALSSRPDDKNKSFNITLLDHKGNVLVALKDFSLRVKKRPDILQRLDNAPADEREDILTNYLQTETAKVLGFQASRRPDPRNNFFDLGIDSLMAVELGNILSVDLHMELPTTLLLETPNIEELSRYLIAEIWKESPADSSEETQKENDSRELQNLSKEELEDMLNMELEE